jgi:hypothetical protein
MIPVFSAPLISPLLLDTAREPCPLSRRPPGGLVSSRLSPHITEAPHRMRGDHAQQLPPLCVGRFHRLAVEHATRRAGFTSNPFADEHQRHVVNGLKRHTAHETPEPPVDRLPRAEIDRQHVPATATARHVANRIPHLAQVNADFAPAFRQFG